MKIALGFPGSTLTFAAALGLHQSTEGRHEVTLIHSPLGAWDAFNALLVDALNMAEAGEITHFAMLHSDSDPQKGWLDVLIDEMERTGADWVSVMSPIKDARGLADVAIADPDAPGSPHRRFTMRELMELPETVDAAALGYPGECLLQGDGCMVADLRRDVFHRLDENGEAQICFNFPTRVFRGPDGRWTRHRESEDWYFSRRLFEAGGRAVATRKVRMAHLGEYPFPNWQAWGAYGDGDEETRVKWDRSGTVIDHHGFWKKDEARYHKHDAALAIGLAEFFKATPVADFSTAGAGRDVEVGDFGCGMGRYVRDFLSAGICAHGYDGSPHTVELTAGLCEVQDLAVPFDDLPFPHVGGPKFDWVMCLEVMEHIPPEFEATALDNLVRHARIGIVLSWCGPSGGDGHGHYNERTEEYVRHILEVRGFAVDREAGAALRARAELEWLRRNLLVFRRQQGEKVTT